MSMCAKSVVAVALLSTTIISNANADKLLRSKHIVIGDGPPPTSLNVRLCNAFADKAPVAISLKPGVRNEKHDAKKHDAIQLSTQGLQYKSCQDWPLNLQRGDTFEFLQGGAQLGAFSVTSVPQWDATLLLIIKRKGTSSRPVFASHVFGKTKNAQLAVLDMYTGPSKHTVVIRENKEPKEPSPDESGHQLLQKRSQSENLAYDTVVAVSEGSYFCSLNNIDQAKASTHAASTALNAIRVAFNVVAAESYVAMRVGGIPGYPEELIVFPSSDSHRIGCLSVTVLAAALLSLLLG